MWPDVMAYFGLYGVSKGYLGVSWGILGHLGLDWAIQDYIGRYWAILGVSLGSNSGGGDLVNTTPFE